MFGEEQKINYHPICCEFSADIHFFILQASKIKSQEITAKVVIAEQTEKDIDVARAQYIPVAVNTQILFFCVADLANIDPMYQYSLEWFISIFLGGIANAERADNVEQRSKNINSYMTFSLYSNVCRFVHVLNIVSSSI